MTDNPPPPTDPGHESATEPCVRLRSMSNHPFIYRRMIGDVAPGVRAGDLVRVLGKRGDYFGRGFYHDRSQIALRMLTHEDEPVDEPFFRRRIERAVAWRQQLINDTTDACRLVHAEGDGLTGLIAERYGDWIAIEVFSLGMFQRLDMIRKLLSEATGITRFVVRADERIEKFEKFQVTPELSDVPPKTITITENGVRFRVDLRHGHKTGFFCDQRDNRRKLAELTAGRTVLDLCCYTGGFGIYAMARGEASQVVGVDLDEDAIALAKANAKLNQVRVQHHQSDAFTYLRQMQAHQRTFDVVVLDPPKFVLTRDDWHEGMRKYGDLNTLAMTVVAPGGLLVTCSCSGLVQRDAFENVVRSSAHRTRRPLQFVDYTAAAPDHPVMANCAESSYLKAIWARL